MQDNLSDLTDDVSSQIVQYLPLSSLILLSQVSSRSNYVANILLSRPDYWEQMVRQDLVFGDLDPSIVYKELYQDLPRDIDYDQRPTRTPRTLGYVPCYQKRRLERLVDKAHEEGHLTLLKFFRLNGLTRE